MKKYIFSLFLGLILLTSQGLIAQDSTKTNAYTTTGFSGNFAWELPGGHMAERFGSNGRVGADFFHKTKSNLVFALEGSFLFGSVINDDSLFHLIKTSGGYIIDGDGMYADIRTYERGFSAMAKAGYFLPFKNTGATSGILFMLGGGFLQHQIRIENPGNTVPQIKDDYRKGYDKLSNGPALSQYIGFMHLSEKRVYNFRAGFEFTQAFTKARRNYDFDLMGKDNTKRLDTFYGIKISWMLPINKRKPADFYYF